jgi:F-type H+-transporting ATPase subunit b
MGIPTAIVFASATSGGGDILSALGIDVKLLAMQIVAFLLLVWALSKWVFPIFFNIVDKRQAVIDEANRAAVDASKQAKAAQDETEALLAQARKDAKDIVATAHGEASTMLDAAEKKSREQAEFIVRDAREQLSKEVLAAKKALHNETVDLVMAATSKVLGTTIDAPLDKAVVATALKEVDS